MPFCLIFPNNLSNSRPKEGLAPYLYSHVCLDINIE